jgi:hypothetical protein
MPREFPEDTNNTHSHANEDNTHNIDVEDSETGVTHRVKLDLEVNASTKDHGKNPYIKWIHMAIAFDAWRPFPRLFIGIYIYILYTTINWYLILPEPTLEQSGFVSIIVGAGAAWFGLYVGSGGRHR